MPRKSSRIENTEIQQPDDLIQEVAEEVLAPEGSQASQEEDWRARYEAEKAERERERAEIQRQIEHERSLRMQAEQLRYQAPQYQQQAPSPEPEYPDVFEKPDEYVHLYTQHQLTAYEQRRAAEREAREAKALQVRIARSEKLLAQDGDSYDTFKAAQADPRFMQYLQSNAALSESIRYDPLPAHAVVEAYQEFVGASPELEARVLAKYGIDPNQVRGQMPAQKFVQPKAQAPAGSIASIRGRTPPGKAVETDPMYMTAEQRRAVERQLLSRRA